MFRKIALTLLVILATTGIGHAADTQTEGNLPTYLPAAVACQVQTGLVGEIRNNSTGLMITNCHLPMHSVDAAPLNLKVIVRDQNPTAGIYGTLKCNAVQSLPDGSFVTGHTNSVSGASADAKELVLEVPPAKAYATYGVSCYLPRKYGASVSALVGIYFEE
ncbi:hypothetical protein [Oryzibacter oryziterrae]|uniref:hypothetical protein n=1 Tax=Oryzibacter oryziterrae TaxID=2766474 RepID=UPI001F3CEA0B|nr:hypothetical protein [Oryzibacter oryziterrae]